MWETGVHTLSREDPLEKEWQPAPVLLPGESHGWRSLGGCSPWGHKELDTTEQLHFHKHHITSEKHYKAMRLKRYKNSFG